MLFFCVGVDVALMCKRVLTPTFPFFLLSRIMGFQLFPCFLGLYIAAHEVTKDLRRRLILCTTGLREPLAQLPIYANP